MVVSGTQKHASCYDQVSNILRNTKHEADSHLFSLHANQDLPFGVLLVIYINFLHVWLAHIVHMLGVISGITIKYRNNEVLRSTWNVLAAAHWQC